MFLFLHLKVLKNLIENKYLLIQKADKGNSIIILNKNDYISRLNRILDDTSKFERQSLKSYHSYGRVYF